MAKRSYKDAFLDFGFTNIVDHGIIKPQCVICCEVLSNESLKSNKLKRHLTSKHPQHALQGRAFFERKEAALKRQRFETPDNPAVVALKQATLASYKVAWRISNKKAPHTIGEDLVKPAAIDMVKTVCGEDVARKLEIIPLSNDTVRRRIVDMSLDIKHQVVDRIKAKGAFSLQLDESTDVSDNAQLLVCVKYEGPVDLEEEFLFCRALPTTTTGEDIFQMVDQFLKEEELSWTNCFSICSDGAPAMLGARKGFTALVKKVNPMVNVVHCLLHRENLVGRHLSPGLNEVMNEAVQIVNYIKTSALNTRLFEQLCADFDAEHRHLLFHSNIRWLSRGKLLRRLLDLRDELEIFLIEKKCGLVNKLANKMWLLQVGYLNDIFVALNNLNISMQGRNQTIAGVAENLSSFKCKLKLWLSNVKRGKFAAFPSVAEFLEMWEETSQNDAKIFIVPHLTELMAEFDRRIPEEHIRTQSWVRNPFNINVEDLPESVPGLPEQLIEVQNEHLLKDLFKEVSLSEFWIQVKKEKSIVGVEAVKVLLPFVTTYLCEQGFSALTHIKNKSRNKLNPEHDMRCSLTTMIPRFDKLVNEKQHHGSH